MAEMHVPHPLRDHPAMAQSLRNAFWVVALGVIAMYFFFLALGAFAIDDVWPVTIAVGVLLALWVAHSLAQRRLAESHDPSAMRARERRGF